MVELSCGYKCLQTLLIIFNTLMFISGLIFIIVGSIGLSSLNIIQINITVGGLIFSIILGIFCFLIGILGCCGVCKKNICFLKLYAILLSIFIIMEIGEAIAAIVYKTSISSLIYDAIKEMVTDYLIEPEFKKVMDTLQENLKCCGIDSPNDYKPGPPDSCKDKVSGRIFETGCAKLISDSVQQNMLTIIVVFFIFAIVQIINLVFAVCVLQAIKRELVN